MKTLAFIFFGLYLSGCTLAPTKVIQEVGGDRNKSDLLADTREALEYSTYHISGSVSLNSEDFLILKDPATRTRILDPDTEQIVERLARRGIHPGVKVTLIGSESNSVENLKWKWLLSKLNVRDVELISLDDFIRLHTRLRPRP